MKGQTAGLEVRSMEELVRWNSDSWRCAQRQGQGGYRTDGSERFEMAEQATGDCPTGSMYDERKRTHFFVFPLEQLRRW